MVLEIKHPKILLVDDEQSIRITLKEFLKDADYEVETAEDADQAMKLLSSQDFDVVVTDIIMPRVTGVGLLKAIKNVSPYVQVILMTGEPNLETASEAVRTDAFDYLTKPIKKEVLIKTISNAAKLKFVDDRRRQLEEENKKYQEDLEIIITERTKELFQSQKFLKTIFDNSELGIWLIKVDGLGKYIYESINKTYEKEYGVKIEECIGKEPRDLEYVRGKKTVDYEYSIYDECVKTKTTHNSEFELHYKDRHAIWIHTSLQPLLNNEGNVYRIIGTSYDITERKLSEEIINRQHRFTSSLRDIDAAITSSFDLNLTLNILLGHTQSQLEVDAATVFLLDKNLNILSYKAGIGLTDFTDVQNISINLGDSYAGLVALDQKLLISDFEKDITSPEFSKMVKEEQFISYASAPVISKGQVLGVLEVYKRTSFEPDAEWIRFFETLASQAAIAIDNISLFNNLQRSNLELSLGYDQTIEGWAKTLEMRDDETEGHSQRVTDTTIQLAKQMGMKAKELVNVRRGALLHDIGKINIPDKILLKEGSLDDEEWRIMRKHTEYACEFLSSIKFLKPALDIPHYHHEKWDGSGYPIGLKGEQIPLAARIFAIVDVYDALLSDRPYRKAWSLKKTVDHIKKQSGIHFDPAVVDAFMQMQNH